MLAAIRAGRALPRTLTLAILAGALLLRLVVPQGWMPVQTSAGLRITLCTGAGPMLMTMDPGITTRAGHPTPDKHDHAPGDHVCAFAGLATALDASAPPALALPRIILASWRLVAGRLVTIGRGLAAPPPPSTGPPLV